MTDFSKEEIILIDDSNAMHGAWSLRGRSRNIKINSFNGPKAFLDAAASFSKNALIYIDSRLGDDERGELESKKIFDLGFHNIHLVTAEPELITGHYPWLKSISDKSPPWLSDDER